jgi:hypothetical protein
MRVRELIYLIFKHTWYSISLLHPTFIPLYISIRGVHVCTLAILWFFNMLVRCTLGFALARWLIDIEVDATLPTRLSIDPIELFDTDRTAIGEEIEAIGKLPASAEEPREAAYLLVIQTG